MPYVPIQGPAGTMLFLLYARTGSFSNYLLHTLDPSNILLCNVFEYDQLEPKENNEPFDNIGNITMDDYSGFKQGISFTLINSESFDLLLSDDQKYFQDIKTNLDNIMDYGDKIITLKTTDNNVSGASSGQKIIHTDLKSPKRLVEIADQVSKENQLAKLKGATIAEQIKGIERLNNIYQTLINHPLTEKLDKLDYEILLQNNLLEIEKLKTGELEDQTRELEKQKNLALGNYQALIDAGIIDPENIAMSRNIADSLVNVGFNPAELLGAISSMGLTNVSGGLSKVINIGNIEVNEAAGETIEAALNGRIVNYL
jgi:hypothetical protein